MLWSVFFRIELLLKSQRPEVEEMVRDMGVGQAAVEQLAVYCVSLKKCVPCPSVPAQATPWHPARPAHLLPSLTRQSRWS